MKANYGYYVQYLEITHILLLTVRSVRCQHGNHSRNGPE
jgi:hypothetical protein